MEMSNCCNAKVFDETERCTKCNENCEIWIEK